MNIELLGQEPQDDACPLPIPGMKSTPYGWPAMAGAYMGLLFFLVSKPEVRAAFKEETGHDLDRVLLGRGIEAMVDKATGYSNDVVAAFADWVTEFYWGDGTEPDDESTTFKETP